MFLHVHSRWRPCTAQAGRPNFSNMASATEEAPKLAEEAPDKQEDAEPREQKQESQQQEPAPAGPEPERPTKRQKTAKFAGLPLEKPLALESLYKGQPAPASSPVKLIGDQTDAAHAHSNREFLQRQLEAVKTLYGVYRVGGHFQSLFSWACECLASSSTHNISGCA